MKLFSKKNKSNGLINNGLIFYFTPSNGLGNTLIELAVLKSLFPKRLIIIVTNSKSLSILKGNFFVIKYKFTAIKRLIVFSVKQILLILSNLKLIGYILENEDNNFQKFIKVRGGLLNFIALIKYDCHFQISKYINNISLPVDLDYCDKLIKNEFFKNEKILDNLDNTCFIHIRRGDYLGFPNSEFPAVLELNWYETAMEIMKRNYKIKKFIVCSDDPFYVKDIFGNLEDIAFFHKNVLTDFLIMSKCKYGILSASSFSFCAAKISRDRYKSNQKFIAPKYWIGHRTRIWYPKEFKFKWINYI